MVVFYLRNILTGQLQRDPRGNVIKAIDRGEIERELMEIEKQGRSILELEIFVVGPPEMPGRNI